MADFLATIFLALLTIFFSVLLLLGLTYLLA